MEGVKGVKTNDKPLLLEDFVRLRTKSPLEKEGKENLERENGRIIESIIGYELELVDNRVDEEAPAHRRE